MSGLHDRIAAVLRASDYWDGCTDRKCVLAPDCEGCLYESNEMADAVIEALGLREQYEYGRVTAFPDGTTLKFKDKRRWATDWESA